MVGYHIRFLFVAFIKEGGRMRLSAWMQSHLGMARSDVTVVSFLAAVAIGGAVFTSFFDSRTGLGLHRDMLLLEQRHDSIMNARQQAPLRELHRSFPADSIPQWTPLEAPDIILDDRKQAMTVYDSAEKFPELAMTGIPFDSVVDAPHSSGNSKPLPTSPVNINTADKATLMQLPDVGEKTAIAIMVYRDHVPFNKPEDVMSIRGIGEKKFEKMKPYITVK
jgi:competence ComEA-like helix-hairpin-helix protein